MRIRGVLRAAVILVIAVTVLLAASGAVAKKGKKKDPDKRLYALRCAGACHRLYKPDEYTAEGWEEILPDMSERAKLSEDEKTRIRGYLLKNAAGTVTKDGE